MVGSGRLNILSSQQSSTAAILFYTKMEGELSQKQKEQLGGAADVVQGVEGFYVHVQTTDASCNWADRANKAIQENAQLKDRVKELHTTVSDLDERVHYLERLVDQHNKALYDQSWLLNRLSAKVLAMQEQYRE